MTGMRSSPIFPAVFGTRRRLSGVVVAFTVLAAVWLVHQTEYLIEYGRAFSAVMHTTPHRFYMAPAGFVLMLVGVGLLSVGTLWLQTAGRKRRSLERRLPRRLARLIPDERPTIPIASIARTALALLLLQATLYVIQENLEMVAIGNGWPLLAVLFAPQHLTVIPLHLLAAACGSLVLWTFAARIRQTGRALRFAAALLRLLRRAAAILRPSGTENRRPVSLYYVRAGRSRAPPVFA